MTQKLTGAITKMISWIKGDTTFKTSIDIEQSFSKALGGVGIPPPPCCI
jgi:hypothetical protein